MSTRDLHTRIKTVADVERGITPNPAWISRTRETLMMQVRNSMPAEKAVPAVRVSGFFSSFIPSTAWQTLQRPMLAVLSILAIVGGGSLAGMSSAEHAGPGDLLYPVKLATEQTRLVFTSNSSDRLQLKTEFVERRTLEIRQLVASNSSDKDKQTQLKQTAQLLKRDLDIMKNQLNEVSSNESSPERIVALAKAIDAKSNDLIVTLKDVRATASEDVKGTVAEAEAAAVNTGIRAVQVLIDASNQPNGDKIVSKEDLLKSIQTRVEGMEETIHDSSSSTTQNASSTSRLEDAQKSINETKQLIQDKNLDAVRDQLTEVVKAVTTAEVQDVRESTIVLPVPDATKSSESTTSTLSITSSTHE